MKQIKNKNYSEETPTQCSKCQMFYSGGSCLGKDENGKLVQFCLKCFHKKYGEK